MHGFLNVNKPAGITSRAALDMVKRVCHPAKVGHTGTLDPIASGVLVVCIGDTTRLAEHIQRMTKSYRATFLLDRMSETDDADGEIRELDQRTDVSQKKLADVLAGFVGRISQVPPKFSAAKVGGRRAYKLARNAVDFELKPRTITIHSIDLIAWGYPRLELDIRCGSGTYVRSLGRDVAAELDTHAVMSNLIRTAVGEFDLESAVDPVTLDAEILAQHLLPPSRAISAMPRLTLSDEEIAELRFGRSVELDSPRRELVQNANDTIEATGLAGLDSQGRLVALLLYDSDSNRVRPRRNFRFD